MRAERTAAIAGVVLAAGTSSRMGTNKLFLEIDGETIVHRAVRRALDARLDPVIVVVGHEADRTREAIAGLSCMAVFNPDYAEGVQTSLRTGIRAVVPTPAAGAIVVLADMPHVTSEMIARLADEYRCGDAPLVISDYDGVNAPPMMYDRSLFDELTASTGQTCGRHVVRRHRHEAISVSWPSAALADLDLPEDVDRIRAAADSR